MGIRDKLLAEGMPQSEYMKLENHTFSKGYGIRPQKQKGTPVPNDPYESGKTEKEVRVDVKEMAKRHGLLAITMYTGGIPLKNGVLAYNPSKGFPDQLIMNLSKKRGCYAELKRNEGGELDADQVRMINNLIACNHIVFISTSAIMLEKQLKESNII